MPLNEVDTINLDIMDSCRLAKKDLQGQPLRILIDNCVYGQASTTHRSVPYKVTINWPPESGDKEYDMPGLEPKYHANKNKDIEENIRYLPGLIYLFVQGHVELLTSDVLKCEQICQPLGRYNDAIGWFDWDMFENVTFLHVDGLDAFCYMSEALEWKNDKIHLIPDFFVKNPSFSGVIRSSDIDPLKIWPNAKQKLQHWLNKKRKEIPEFDSLVISLGENNIQDAWHIYTAYSYKLDYFLTLDFRLIRILKTRKNHEIMQKLNVQVVPPKHLAQIIHLRGILKENLYLLNRNTVCSNRQ